MKGRRSKKKQTRKIRNEGTTTFKTDISSNSIMPELEFWEVVHTRTVTFKTSIGLDEMADRLITAKACCAIMSSKGWYLHMPADEPVVKQISIQTRPHQTSGSVVLDDIEDDLVRATLLDSIEVFHIERKTFSPETLDTHQYIRCIFEPFFVEIDNKLFRLYPNAKIYSNDVCVMSLRILSGTEAKSLDDLADSILDLGRLYFNNLFIPASVKTCTPAADVVTSFLALNQGVTEQYDLDTMADALAGTSVVLYELGKSRHYFKTDLAKVNGYVMLDTIWDTLHGLLDDLAFRPKKWNLSAIALRKSAFPAKWFGHPIVFVLKWDGQPSKASEILSSDKAVARLVVGTSEVSPDSQRILSQPITRIYDDYLHYMSEGSSVYFASRCFFERAFEDEIGFQRITLPLMANQERALWLVGSYRSLQDQAKVSSTEAHLSRIGQSLYNLDEIRSRVSQFADLHFMFAEYLDRFDVPSVSRYVSSRLERLEHHLRERASRRLSAFALMISLLFGLLGSGQLSESVLSPLRESGVAIPIIAGLPKEVSDFVMSCLILSAVCKLIWFTVLRRTVK